LLPYDYACENFENIYVYANAYLIWNLIMWWYLWLSTLNLILWHSTIFQHECFDYHENLNFSKEDFVHPSILYLFVFIEIVASEGSLLA